MQGLKQFISNVDFLRKLLEKVLRQNGRVNQKEGTTSIKPGLQYKRGAKGSPRMTARQQDWRVAAPTGARTQE